MKVLKIGAFKLPLLAALDLQQAYEPLGGEAIFRSVAGNGIKQATWRRTKITTSGSGWLPAGLEAIDTAVQQELACVIPRVLPADFSTRSVVLPAGRRGDAGHLPYGLAFLAGGGALPVAASLVGNLATVDPLPGVVAYGVGYYPLYTVWAARPTASGNRGDASHRWEIVCEEA